MFYLKDKRDDSFLINANRFFGFNFHWSSSYLDKVQILAYRVEFNSLYKMYAFQKKKNLLDKHYVICETIPHKEDKEVKFIDVKGELISTQYNYLQLGN